MSVRLHMSVSLQIQQLQKKDSQLKALDAFYKEQLAQLEKKVKGYTILLKDTCVTFYGVKYKQDCNQSELDY